MYQSLFSQEGGEATPPPLLEVEPPPGGRPPLGADSPWKKIFPPEKKHGTRHLVVATAAAGTHLTEMHSSSSYLSVLNPILLFMLNLI